MKTLITYLLFFLNCLSLKSQDLFKLGLKSYQDGNIYTADSLFAKHIEENPNDYYGYFNYGVTRLYLQDTIKFCKIMLEIRDVLDDKKATELYFKYCGDSDTVYYDASFNLIPIKKGARYTEIIEKSKYDNYSTVIVQDKKHNYKTAEITPFNIMNPKMSNTIAIYRIYNDSSKLYLFTLTPPKFPGTDEAFSDYKANSPYIDQAKKELGLKKFIVDIEYIVDNEGNIKDINLIGTNYRIKDNETLIKYIKLIVESMPKQIPAKYRDIEVNYLVETHITFW